MKHKIYLKVVKGRWYISLGCKGYKSTYALNRALSTLIHGESAEVTFTSDRTENSAYKAVVTRKDNLYILELHDLDTDELKMSIEQCPKIFNDFDIGSEFYINYKPNDN